MRFASVKSVIAASMLLLAATWGAGAQGRLLQTSYAAVGSETSVPYGWVDFCGRRPEECDVQRLPAVDVRLTEQAWAVLDRINRKVNSSIEPISNFDHWGTMLDHWDYPVDGKGDCKIYALYKRKLLLDGGFPRQALLMTIVRDLEGEGHAILTVKTDHGEFVLDNLSDEIRPWNATGYRFVKRQSQEDPNLWVSIGDSVKGARYATR
jgi:predicted transglutaminase-like cysteine proteinase